MAREQRAVGRNAEQRAAERANAGAQQLRLATKGPFSPPEARSPALSMRFRLCSAL
jgi:hypothetical protein